VDGEGCVRVSEVCGQEGAGRVSTPAFEVCVYMCAVGLVGVRISRTGGEEKSHRSVFAFTKIFVPLPVVPTSALAAVVRPAAVTGFAADGLGLVVAMLRLKAAIAAAEAADV
jgi:hypothetical protein